MGFDEFLERWEISSYCFEEIKGRSSSGADLIISEVVAYEILGVILQHVKGLSVNGDIWDNQVANQITNIIREKLFHVLP